MATMALIVWPPSPSPKAAAVAPPPAVAGTTAAAPVANDDQAAAAPDAAPAATTAPPTPTAGGSAAGAAAPALADIFLPEDVLLAVLSRLTSVADVAAARGVCVRWRAAVDGCGGLWRALRLPLVRRRNVRAAESWCVGGSLRLRGPLAPVRARAVRPLGGRGGGPSQRRRCHARRLGVVGERGRRRPPEPSREARVRVC